MARRGIMLVQPEHLLSFKLMGIECLLNGQHDVGRSLLRTQHFFDNNARDIVDESDENFSVKFELVYTMGRYNVDQYQHLLQRLPGKARQDWLASI